MNILPLRHHRFDRDGIKLPIWTLSNQHFRSVREKLRRAALIGFHMRNLRTNNRVITLAKRRQRKRIRRRAVENKKHLALRIEHLPNQIRRPRRKDIVTIPRRMPAICRLQRFPRLRANPRIIVRSKLPTHGLVLLHPRRRLTKTNRWPQPKSILHRRMRKRLCV